jgi:hypothetical protein
VVWVPYPVSGACRSRGPQGPPGTIGSRRPYGDRWCDLSLWRYKTASEAQTHQLAPNGFLRPISYIGEMHPSRAITYVIYITQEPLYG